MDIELIHKIANKEISAAEALNLVKAHRDNQLTSAFAVPEPSRTERFRYDEPYLRDHLVMGEQVLLGTTHCSLAIEAGLKMLPQRKLTALHKVLFVEPIILLPNETATVTIEQREENGRVFFESMYTKTTGNQPQKSASGELIFTPQGKPVLTGLQTVREDPERIMAKAEIYGQQQTEAILHGPALQTVEQVYTQSMSTVARLRLSEEIVADGHLYEYVHPALLDGALVAGTTVLVDQIHTPFIPILIKEVQLFEPIGTTCYSYSKVVTVNSEIIELNCWLCNEAGDVQLGLIGFTCKRLRTETTAGEFSVPHTTPMAPTPTRTTASQVGAGDLVKPIIDYLKEKLGALTGKLNDTGLNDRNFMDLGVDSTQLISLVREIEVEVGIDLYPTLLFEYQTIVSLATYLAQEYRTPFAQVLKVANKQNIPRDGIATVHQVERFSPPRIGPKPDKEVMPFAAHSGSQVRPKITEVHIHETSTREPIAVIGMAGVFPQSPDVTTFWQHLLQKTDLIREIPDDHFDYRPWYDPAFQVEDKLYCKWGSFIDDVDKFDAGFFNISPREAGVMDPQLRYLLQVLHQTAEDAGHGGTIRGSHTGVYVGVCFHDYADAMAEQGQPIQPHNGTGNAATMLANRPSFYFDLTGPSLAIDTACSSSLFALHHACIGLQNGECEMAFAAGVNLLLSSAHYRYFCTIGALSPTGRCHTFDERADGYVPGEAIASVLLKPLSQAIQANDQIYGVIQGSAVGHGGYTPSITAPSVDGEAKVLLAAWEDAGINPETLGYIEAHGTGTKLGDPIEIAALTKAFQQHTQQQGFCVIGSAKAHIGHTEGAAGITGVIKALLSLRHGMIPAMPRFETRNPYIQLDTSPFTINREPIPWPQQNGLPRRAGVSSFGFGGAYAHVVLEEYASRPEAGTSWVRSTTAQVAKSQSHKVARLQRDHMTISDPVTIKGEEPQIIVLSARNEERLREYAHNLLTYLAAGSTANTAFNELAETPTIQSIHQSLQRIIAEILGLEVAEIGHDQPFDECGFDTVQLTQLQTKVAEQYDVDLTITVADSLESLAQQLSQQWHDMIPHNLQPTPLVLSEAEGYNLRNIAYTLQVGREAMEVRLALVVSTVEGLIEQLRHYQQQDRVVDIYHGNTKSSMLRHSSETLIGGEAGEAFIEIAIRNRELKRLAELWVLGVEIDWSLLHRGQKPWRISLPTYPFAQERYWFVQTDHANHAGTTLAGHVDNSQAKILHPLIHHNRSTFTEQRFSSSFRGNEFFLKDHQVQHKMVLPGVAYLEMARAAAEMAAEGASVTALHDIVWLRPLTVDHHEMREVHISLHRDTHQETRYEVISQNGNGESLVHGRGRLRFGTVPEETTTIDLDAIRQRCPKRKSGMACYQQFEQLGLHYGPTFQVLEEVLSNETEALAKVRLPSTMATDTYLLHPSLLDGVLQSTIGLIDDLPESASYLPFTLDALEIFVPTPAIGYAYVTRVAKGSKTSPTDTIHFNLALLDETGQICLKAHRFTLKVLTQSTTISLPMMKAVEHATDVTSEPNPVSEQPTTAAADQHAWVDSASKKVERILIQIVSDCMQIAIENIDPDMPYAEFGVDSILAVEIINRINHRLGSTLHTTDLFNYTNIHTLGNHIVATSPEQVDHHAPQPAMVKAVESPLAHLFTYEPPLLRQEVGHNGNNRTNSGYQKLGINTKAGVDIAIIGISGRFPGAETVTTFWENLAQGHNAIRNVLERRWRGIDFYSPDVDEIARSYSKWAGLLDDIAHFDPLFFNISPREAELMDPQQRLFLQEAWSAIEDAGYAGSTLAGKKCGIFVGCSAGDYQQQLGPEHQEAYSFMGNSSAILAARIAYHLNLKGPSLAIDTACSSSLVAIHLACESLRLGTSEMAIAGGVSILTTPNFHILASQAGMLSPQGQCHTFAQGADGFVPSEGVGVVILKTLAQAVADGDHIYGVIKGSAINQDGKTNGITAPNGPSQTALATDVYARYDIDPATISYVEAHGTGTALGDPIEVSALTNAFHQYTDQTGYCAIGSVKTNIGHTLTAAGVAGVIKVLLALKHKQLPPSLHFDTPNEHIDFANSPFYVNTDLQEWPAGVTPRRAAISSFGFSGTNAHLVIEEYVSRPEAGTSWVRSATAEQPMANSQQLILLSAKNEERLREYAQRLLTHLTSSPDIQLTKLAYTLQVGREAMVCRLAFVADDIDDAICKLTAYLENNDNNLYQGQLNHSNQQANLLTELFTEGAEEHNFIKSLMARHKQAKLAQLWVAGLEIDWALLYADSPPQRISLPTYPFAQERYWFAQTVDAEHAGTTLASPVDSSQAKLLHPLVHQNRSTFTKQCFSSSFGGNEFFLRDHQVQHKMVLPGVAYLEMARAAAEIAADGASVTAIKDVVWLRPITVDQAKIQEVYLSLNRSIPQATDYAVTTQNSDGESIIHGQGKLLFGTLPEELTTIDLDVIRQRCSKQISGIACYERFEQLGLHYGPTFQVLEEVISNEMEALVKLCLPKTVATAPYYLHPSLLDGVLQSAIGLMDTQPASAPYLPFALDALEIFAPTPTIAYAYVTRVAGEPDGSPANTAHFNLALLDKAGRVCLKLHRFTLKTLAEPAKSWYYQPEWIQQSLSTTPGTDGNARSTNGAILLVLPNALSALGDLLADHYPQQPVYRLILNDEQTQLDEKTWKINLADGATAMTYLQTLPPIDTLYFLGGLSQASVPPTTLEILLIDQQQSVVTLFHLVKLLGAHGLLSTLSAIKVLTNRNYLLQPHESIQPWGSTLSGFTMSLANEFPALAVSCIDVTLTTNDAGQALLEERDIAAIVATSNTQGHPIGIRQGLRYVRQLTSVALPLADPAITENALGAYRQNGVYLILGGANGIGLEAAVHLAQTVQAKLVLVGRSALTAAKEKELNRIKAAGGDYLYCQADGTDLAQMQAVVRQAKATFGALHGVIHSALVLRDSPIHTMDEPTLLATLAPKVTGTVILAEAVKDESLDFLLFFSSSQSFWGNAGQSNYAAGGTFQDAYALYLNQTRSYPVKVINWGYWGSVGVVATEDYRQRLTKQGIHSIEVAEGMSAIDQILASPFSQVAAIKADRSVLTQMGVQFQQSGVLSQPANPSLFEQTLVQLSREVSASTAEISTIEDEIAGHAALETFAQGTLVRVFQQMGMFQSDGEQYAADTFAQQLAVVPKYDRLTAACLSILEEGGYVIPKAGGVYETTLKVNQAADLDAERLLQQYPMLQPHLHLLTICLEALPEILQGHLPATDVIFPNSSFTLVQDIYRGTPLTDYFNQLTAIAVKSSIEQRLPTLSRGEKLRIIEIGAGTGGTSSFVLPAIASYQAQIEYLYSDISQGFLRHGQQQFGVDYPFVQFGLLDIEQPPVKGEMERHRAEIVFGTNVVHATKQIQRTLQNLKTLLKANGPLILNELTQFSSFSTLTFGLLDGWWLFEDGEERIKHTPLLSTEQWHQALQTAGFRVADGSVLTQVTSQALLLAESDGQVQIAQQHRQPFPMNSVLALPASSVRPRESIVSNAAKPLPSSSVNGDLRTATATYLQILFAEILKSKPERLQVEQTFEAYGIDSIVSIEIVNRLRQDFGSSLSATILFEYMSLAQLAEYFLTHHRTKLNTLLAVAPTALPTLRQPTAAPQQPSTDPTHLFAPPAHLQQPTLARVERQQDSSDIAVIGLSGRYPMASDLGEFWENLKTGRNCIREIPAERWDHALHYHPEKGSFGKSYNKWGGFIDDIDKFDPLFFNISPREAAQMDPQERLFLETVWTTLEDGGYGQLSLTAGKPVGVFVGTMYHHYPFAANNLEEAAQLGISSYWQIANRVSYFFNFQGPSIAIDTACSSSLTAIYLACESIKRGECEMAIAGGVNLSLHPTKWLALSQLQMLGSEGKSKSLGDGDGFVPGEGVGAVLLKPLEQAIADNDHIYATIKGGSLNHGGRTSSFTVPNPNAQADLIRHTFEKTGVDPRTISYIEVAANGSALGDPIEIAGLQKAFQRAVTTNSTEQEEQQWCSIGSVKSNIGHLEAASGISQLTKVILQLNHQMLVPSINADPVNPNLQLEETPFRIQQEVQHWEQPTIEQNGKPVVIPRRAAISSFGAGGSNAHLIVEEFVANSEDSRFASVAEESAIDVRMNGSNGAKRKQRESQEDEPGLIVLSARSSERLRVYVQKMVAFVSSWQGKDHPIAMTDLAYTLQTGREPLDVRLAFVARNEEELLQGFHAYLTDEEQLSATISLFQGNAEYSQEEAKLLVDGTVGEEMLQKSIIKRDWERLAFLWTKGVAIAWEELYTEGETPQRLSLPTYPFERQRYWLAQNNAPDHQSPQAATEETAVVFQADPTRTQQENLRDYLSRLLSQLLQISADAINPEKDLYAYGVDSVMGMQLRQQIEATFGMALTGRELVAHNTVQSLTQFLSTKLNDNASEEETGIDPVTVNPEKIDPEEAALEQFKNGEIDEAEIKALFQL